MVGYLLSHPVCHVLLDHGKDMLLILVYRHSIFLPIVLINVLITFLLSIVLFNLLDLFDLSSNNSLLMKTPRCTHSVSKTSLQMLLTFR
jgi:hypothetical protein